MKAKSRIKTRGKLIISFAVIVAAISATLFISFSNIRKMKDTQITIITLDSIAYELSGLKADENRIRALTFDLLISKNEEYKNNLRKQISDQFQEIELKFIGIDKMLIDFPDLKDSLNLLIEDSKLYNQAGQKLLTQIENNNLSESYSYANEINNKNYEEVRGKYLALENEVMSVRNHEMNDNSQLIRRVNIELALLGISLTILTLIVAFLILRILRNISNELKSGISVLSNSTNDILSTVNEVSTSAAETATAVSETTTTIEEVRQTAMVANQKAQSLIESSQKAADSAEKGKDSVVEVIDAMNKIDHQMNMITDTVVKLSEQNRTIGEITSSVSDIADQSNLLAVNAAIEAAKAGEHGRGFSVVAQEIRSLADQSKKATKQVKEILNEINKSVNQAVGVTEQATKTVQNGLHLVQQSGEVIDLLAENVEETAQVSMQISSSNHQQMAGMDQIVPAMENIKSASEQNIQGIHHAQTASNEINHLGQVLKSIILKYNL